MKYLLLVLALFYIISTSAMVKEKPRRDCCYLAGLAKSCALNMPGAVLYSAEEYAIKGAISMLDKMQKTLATPDYLNKKKTE